MARPYDSKFALRVDDSINFEHFSYLIRRRLDKQATSLQLLTFLLLLAQVSLHCITSPTSNPYHQVCIGFLQHGIGVQADEGHQLRRVSIVYNITYSTDQNFRKIGFEVVHISVGPSYAMKTFVVYKAPLCRKAAYFDRMFNGNWHESRVQTAHLPEDVCEAFELFVIWLLRDKIELPAESEIVSLIPTLIHLFAFAEKYNIVVLADETMECLMSLLLERDWLPSPKDMELAYDITHASSKLRLFMVRMFAFIIFFVEDDYESDTWNKNKMQPLMHSCTDLCADFFALMRDFGVPQTDPRKTTACDYHEHAKGEACPYKLEIGVVQSAVKLVSKKAKIPVTYGTRGRLAAKIGKRTARS